MGQKKEIGNLNTEDLKPWLLIGGVVLGYVAIIRPLFEGLGLLRSGDTRELDSASVDPGSWWNPNYYKTKPYNIAYTNPITKGRANELAEMLYDQFGWFNDNEEGAVAVFKSLPSQAAGSYLSEAFREIYGQDMLAFLRGGIWPQDRLSDADVNLINNYVKSLPKY